MRYKFPPTFSNGLDRSAGTVWAESMGFESSIHAARRLRIKSWRHLEAYAEFECFDRYEQLFSMERHHRRIRGKVELIAYYRPEAWNIIVAEYRQDRNKYNDWI